MPSSTSAVGPDGFGRGKTIFILAIVVGCFGILWPKIFYPMFTASINGHSDEACCDVISEKDTNAYHLATEICLHIIQQDSKTPLDSGQGKKIQISKPMSNLCRNEVVKQCGVDISPLLKENADKTKEYKQSLNQIRSFNTSHCLKLSYGVDVTELGLARMTKGPFSSPSHMRPERLLRPEMLHPALREKGQAIPSPRRTIEREARPGPIPGMRPPVAQAAHVPQTTKGSGTMGIVMPMYTLGIVVFFVYTLMKILFKKPLDEVDPLVKPAPILKDFGMDPEHRKYVFSEEYANGSERSMKEEFSKEDRERRNKAPAPAKPKTRFQDDPIRRIDPESVSLQEEFLSSKEVTSDRPRSISPSPPTLTIEPPTPSTPPVDDNLSSYQNQQVLHDKSSGELSQPLNEIELIEHEYTTITTTTTTTTITTILKPTLTLTSNHPPCDPTDNTHTNDRLTPEQLTTAALFFDQTIEEFIEPEFELVSDTKKLLDNSSHPSEASRQDPRQQKHNRRKSPSPTLEIPPTRTPPSELVEYAANLAQRILNDATSTEFISNVESRPELTLDLVQPIPETKKNTNQPTNKEVDQVQSEPIEEEKLTVKPIPQDILDYSETLAKQILKDGQNNFVSQSQKGHSPTNSCPVTDSDSNSCRKDSDTLPVITHFDSIRKNSEPSLTGQYSRLEISPVDECSLVGQAVGADTLEGYVTMVGDEGRKEGLRRKAFLKNLGCGVEITALDEVEDTSESQEKVSHRVMSMDSNDSIVTIKELDDTRHELEQVEIEIDLKTGESQDSNQNQFETSESEPSKIIDTDLFTLQSHECGIPIGNSESPTISPDTSATGTGVLISNEITNEPKPDLDLDPVVFPSHTQSQSRITTFSNESQKENEIWPSDKENIKQLLEQVIDQAESAVIELQSQPKSLIVIEMGESIKKNPELNQNFKVSETLLQPLDLDFKSADHLDPEIDAMYSFLSEKTSSPCHPPQIEPEMELEFLPDVHPQSVPPITLESCTNPLKSSVMAALTEPLIQQSVPETFDIIPKDDDGGDTKSLITLNKALNPPASELTPILTTHPTESSESNRSAKRNEIAGDAINNAQTAPREQEVARKDPGGEEKAPGREDRDAIVKAMQGILDQLSEQTSKVETEALTEKPTPPTEELSCGSGANKQEKEVDIDQLKGSKLFEEKAAEGSGSPKIKSAVKRHPSVEKEVKFQLPSEEEVAEDEEVEDEEEEEEPIRPPTPPRMGSKKSKHRSSPSSTITSTPTTPTNLPRELILFAQQLSENIIQQSAAAAIAAVKQATPQGHREILSVLGIEETAEMESGEKWDDRTPTPTFRMATPPVPHRPSSPPEEIPSIFLEGPLPTSGQSLMVSDSQVEIEGGDGDDDYENATNPIILSGKVTLSVISGGGGAPDEITDASASSLSYDDRAQAGKGKKTAIKAEKGLSNTRKSPSSSHAVEDYEVIKKAEMDQDGQKEDDLSVSKELDELPKDEE